MSDENSLRVLIFQDEKGVFVAQCVEYDICAFADSEEKVKARFEKQVEVERALSNQETGQDFGGIPESPAGFHKMWDDNCTSHKVNKVEFPLAA